MMILIAMIFTLSIPIHAMDFTAPPAPKSVSEAVSPEADSFSEGLWNVFKFAMMEWNPSLHRAMAICLRTVAVILLCSILQEFAPSVSSRSIELAATVAVSLSLMEPSCVLIQMGVQTVRELSEYGKLLLPVMTGALAAQGGFTSSTTLYAGTALFDALLSSCVTKLMIPMIYLYLAVSIANSSIHEDILAHIKGFIKWAMTWVLKIVLYLFTGYIAITGVISGSADAAALKAAKITISGAVPVIGGILSDASEAVLLSAGVLRSAAGVYGVLTILAIFARPFVQLGVQYILMKGSSAICSAFSSNGASKLVGDFSDIMGVLLAIVSTQSVLLLISTVCFMKGVI